jgi:hypothetical protein
MKSPVSATTEHRRSPGTSASAGWHHSRSPRVSTGTSVLLICLAAALVLIPAAAAADTGSIPGNGSVAGIFPTVNISIVNTSTGVGNVSLALNVPPANNLSQEAPTEASSPAATPSSAATVSNATNLTQEEKAAQQAEMEDLEENAGRCYMKRDYTCAWSYYETIRLKYPSDLTPFYMESVILADQGNFTGAIDKVDAAIAREPDDSDMWKLKGDLMNRAGRYTESGASYDRAKELDPEIQIPLTNRFPFNLGMRNLVLVTIMIGFCGLGIYVYFREFHE